MVPHFRHHHDSAGLHRLRIGLDRAEIGRQPWTIQDLLPVSAAISDIEAGSVATTFFIFLALFTTMLAVEISILVKQIKKGPEYE